LQKLTGGPSVEGDHDIGAMPRDAHMNGRRREIDLARLDGSPVNGFARRADG